MAVAEMIDGENWGDTFKGKAKLVLNTVKNIWKGMFRRSRGSDVSSRTMALDHKVGKRAAAFRKNVGDGLVTDVVKYVLTQMHKTNPEERLSTAETTLLADAGLNDLDLLEALGGVGNFAEKLLKARKSAMDIFRPCYDGANLFECRRDKCRDNCSPPLSDQVVPATPPNEQVNAASPSGAQVTDLLTPGQKNRIAAKQKYIHGFFCDMECSGLVQEVTGKAWPHWDWAPAAAPAAG